MSSRLNTSVKKMCDNMLIQGPAADAAVLKDFLSRGWSLPATLGNATAKKGKGRKSWAG